MERSAPSKSDNEFVNAKLTSDCTVLHRTLFFFRRDPL